MQQHLYRPTKRVQGHLERKTSIVGKEHVSQLVVMWPSKPHDLRCPMIVGNGRAHGRNWLFLKERALEATPESPEALTSDELAREIEGDMSRCFLFRFKYLDRVE